MTRPEPFHPRELNSGRGSIRGYRRDHDDSLFGEATIGPGSNLRSTKLASKDTTDPNESRRTGCGTSAQDADTRVSTTTDATTVNGTDGSSRFRAAGELGRGGWGIVQRARDQVLDREVAIKRIIGDNADEDLREQFLHEAKITGRLQHPGVVPVHELAQSDGGDVFYVMKLLDGETFRTQIRRHHQQYHSIGKRNAEALSETIKPLLERFIDICNTVAYAHQQGILHRDLKPANVMIGEFGETIVLDWGLAKTVDEIDHEGGVTLRYGLGDGTSDSTQSTSRRRSERNGVVIGTPAYMSPEQANGQTSALDHRSDVFSLGVILYEIVSGQHPHAGLKTDAILHRARDGEYESLKARQPHASVALVAIVNKAMALAPRDRYDSALDLADDVRHWMLGEPVSVHPGTLSDRCSRWIKRHRTLATGLASSAAILLISASVFSILIHGAHQAEKQARRSAEAANRTALKRLIEARDATDTWLIDLSGVLRYYPGLQAERHRLIQKAIAQYQDLATEQSISETIRSTEPLEKLERGKCYLRLGDLHRLTGEIGLASKNYDHAQQIFESIDVASTGKQLRRNGLSLRLISTASVDQPEAPPAPMDNKLALQHHLNVELANCLIGQILAVCVQSESTSSNSLPTTAATVLDSTLTESIKTAEQLLSAVLPPSSNSDSVDEIQIKAVSSQLRLDLAIAHRSDVDPTIRLAHAQSAADWGTWLSSHREQANDRAHLLDADETLALLYEETDAPNEAIEVWSNLITTIREQTSRLPSIHPRLLQTAAHARIRRAKLLLKTGDRAAAIEDYEKAIEQLNHAWQASDPDDFYRTNLATAEFNLGKVYSTDPDHSATAQSLLRRSSQTYKELLQQRPTVEVLRRLTDAKAKLAELTIGTDDEVAHLDDALVGFEVLDDHTVIDRQDLLRWLKLLVRRVTLTDGGHVNGNRHKQLEQIQYLADSLHETPLPIDLQSQIDALQDQSE
ncbi:protein kinase domain-containing protein [Roseiconus lacunae]|uniref:Protein kinase n=1 Tax=Roseiconus lacunae TaxID=2605694 RepID=A0ABT7PHM5_9BACT|nr:protein kinase [Roseiconus lacunae]MDM4015691.1 protein kinase [Roseiconus lacunae]